MTAQVVDGVLYGADDLVGEWINARMGDSKPDVPFVAMGVFHGDRIALGTMFFNQQDADITVAFAAEPKGCKTRAIARIMAYPFLELGLPRVTAEIPLSNKASIRFAEGLGFVREGVKRRAAPDGGHVGVFGLLKKDFKLKRYWPQ
jgi:RimJ/RimL family protein N-acetyltransferase